MAALRAPNKRGQAVSRRTFLEIGLAAAGGLIAAGIVSRLFLKELFDTDGNPYERGYEVDESLLRRVDLDPTYTVPSPKEAEPAIKAGITYISGQGLPDPDAKGKRFIPEKILSVRKYVQQSFVVEPDHDYAERVIGLSKTALSHALSFWPSPYLVNPKVNFVIPRSAADAIQTPPANIVNINMVYSILGRDGILVDFDYGGKIATSDYWTEEKVAGEQLISPTFRVLENDVVYEGEEQLPLFVSLSSQPIYIAETVPAEVLHYQMRPHTLRNMLAEFNKIPRDPYGGVDANAISDTTNRWMMREEVLTHAIIKLWLRDYNIHATLGFSTSELEGKVYGPRTPDSAEMGDRISGRIKEAVEAYARSPEDLFGV
ncbi:MAG: hypothetical protein HY516_02560 [Candidatus Aenigmarchaeota archaeon]|nr:hypothetical protein [Candidatus Aenigmarchaeota archaeon]